MEPERLIPVLERIVYTIFILTVSEGKKRHAMVVSWVTQVSWNPPRVAVGIRKNRYAHAMISRGKNFALHLLGKDLGDHIASIAAALGEDAAAGRSADAGISGAPILSDCLGVLECSLHQAVDAGDHTLFIGDVVRGHLMHDADALCTREYGKTYLGQR